MNLIKKIFSINVFYVKLEIYCSFLVFSYSFFDNFLFIDIKKYFCENNINLTFIKNNLFKHLIFNFFLYNYFVDLIFYRLIYFFSFNLFYSLNICFFSFLKKENYFFKFGFFNNIFFSKYKIYFLYFIFTKKNIYRLSFYLKFFFKKFIFILNNIMINLSLNDSKFSNTSIKEILNLIDNLSVLELNELINSLELKYNINNSLLNIDNNSDIKKEKNTYSLYLSSVGSNKISVIKLVRELTNLGLKESKDLVDSAPVLIKDNIDIDIANNMKKRFEDIGSLIEIK